MKKGKRVGNWYVSAKGKVYWLPEKTEKKAVVKVPKPKRLQDLRFGKGRKLKCEA